MMHRLIDSSPTSEPYTQVPNSVIDCVLPLLHGSEFSVLMVVIRKTHGHHKTEDTISYSQFVKATGLAQSTVVTAIEGLIEKGFLSRRAGKKYKGKELIYKYLPPKPKPNLKAVPKNGKVTERSLEESLWQ